MSRLLGHLSDLLSSLWMGQMMNKWLLRCVGVASWTLIVYGVRLLAAPLSPNVDSNVPNHKAQMDATRQPLRVEELSPTELFKVMLIHDTQPVRPSSSPVVSSRNPEVGAAAGTDRNAWSKYKLSSFLDYPPFSQRDFLVSFDPTRPPAQLPSDSRDLHKSIRSYAHDKFYLQLNRNHHASRITGGDNQLDHYLGEGHMEWLDAVTPRTRAVTTHQITKDTLMGRMRAEEWAAEVQRLDPASMMDRAKVRASLENTWKMWSHGMKEATGHGWISAKEIEGKILRR